MELPSRQFRYDSLPTAEDLKAIRVIELLPGSGSSPLTCNLKVVHPGDDPTYEALSYFWGSPVFDKQVVISDAILNITNGLHSALHCLRNPAEIRIIWADAICINQRDVDERNAQVQLMREIYQKSQRVLVWLGDQGDGSDSALSLIPRLLAARQQQKDKNDRRNALEMTGDQIKGYGIPQLGDPDWEAFCSIFERPWFRRVWIIQEVAMALEAIMLCGDAQTTWVDLVHALRYAWKLGMAISGAGASGRAFDAALLIDLAKKEVQTGIQPLLLWLMCRYRNSLAADPRDKIFALAGLAKERNIWSIGYT